jgi:diguanylate cyclase
MEPGVSRCSNLDFSRVHGSFPLLAQAIDSAGDAILIVDAEDRVVWANRAFTRMSGFHQEEVVGANIAALHCQTQPGDSYRSLRLSEVSRKGVWRRELIRKHRDGTIYITEEIVTPLLDQAGAITHFVTVLRDVTQSRAAMQQERLQARQDTLTGLAGRAHILELLSSAVVAAQQSQQILAVLFIDLDGFKQINDSSGHHVGDAVLRAVAARLQGAIRCTDTVARFGGDEFLVLLPTVSGRGVARRIGRKIVHQLAQPFAIGPERHELSASVGAAFHPEHGQTPEALLINADAAMYRSKRNGGNQFRIADPSVVPIREVPFRQEEAIVESSNLYERRTAVSARPEICIDS